MWGPLNYTNTENKNKTTISSQTLQRDRCQGFKSKKVKGKKKKNWEGEREKPEFLQCIVLNAQF